MFDFNDVRSATKSEQIRAWCIDQAIESYSGDSTYSEAIVQRAAKFEEFILEDTKED